MAGKTWRRMKRRTKNLLYQSNDSRLNYEVPDPTGSRRITNAIPGAIDSGATVIRNTTFSPPSTPNPESSNASFKGSSYQMADDSDGRGFGASTMPSAPRPTWSSVISSEPALNPQSHNLPLSQSPEASDVGENKVLLALKIFAEVLSKGAESFGLFKEAVGPVVSSIQAFESISEYRKEYQELRLQLVALGDIVHKYTGRTLSTVMAMSITELGICYQRIQNLIQQFALQAKLEELNELSNQETARSSQTF
ncbi:hypothetical protein RhiJN_03622 [Ceratobasidium sp. AG-Ba]|nr:hypothetical protein RhiJN_03622 [Ceratobasidium sp. AG-Ba]